MQQDKLDIRTYIYMIWDKDNGLHEHEAYETKSLAEFIIEIRFTKFWIENEYVKVVTLPVKFLKEIA